MLNRWFLCFVPSPHIITGFDLQGRFELLSLSGSFMPTENCGTRSRSGGMSVSLASPDGRVVGGGVAGLLVAGSPVQVINIPQI
jgi:predicted DNA-binding protein with PD1-like motif